MKCFPLFGNKHNLATYPAIVELLIMMGSSLSEGAPATVYRDSPSLSILRSIEHEAELSLCCEGSVKQGYLSGSAVRHGPVSTYSHTPFPGQDSLHFKRILNIQSSASRPMGKRGLGLITELGVNMRVCLCVFVFVIDACVPECICQSWL